MRYVRSARTRSTISLRPVARANVAGEQRGDPLENRAIAGDGRDACQRVVLGLREQLARDVFGTRALVAHDQHFRRSGEPVDPARAEDLALRFGHVDVPGSDDLIDRRDRRRAVGQRRNGLRAADRIELVDAAQAAGVPDRGVDRPVALRRGR